MKTVMMVTADYAAVEPQTGKLNVIGVFNRILVRHFPVIHRRMYFAVKLEGELSDNTEAYTVLANLTDEDGREIWVIEGQFVFPDSPPGIPPQCSIVMEINSLRFGQPGDYLFQIQVNDAELEESTVLQVVQHEP